MAALVGPATEPRLHLAFRPDVRLVTIVRRFVIQLYSHVLPDSDATESIAMATHELLENALKYSVDGTTQFTVHLAETAEGIRITVETENPASAEDAARAADFVRRMAETDPMEHYIELMNETAPKEEGSGLGLARLVAEAGVAVSSRVDGTTLVIVAEFVAKKPEAA